MADGERARLEGQATLATAENHVWAIFSGCLGGNAGAGVMVESVHAGVQTLNFLRSFSPSEFLPTSFLTSCGTVRLLDRSVV